jgi:hypothetical protein
MDTENRQTTRRGNETGTIPQRGFGIMAAGLLDATAIAASGMHRRKAMNTETRNERTIHGRMRRTGVLTLALLMMILPIAAAGAFALTEGDESQVDVAVVRARVGQYLAAASGEYERFSLTSDVDPMGPVHGDGYNAWAGSGLFALTSGVDPSGPIHGSSLTCLEQFELDILC